MSVPVCVIVGVGPGNGAAFARRFSRAGYHVALLARSRDVLDTLVAELAGTYAYVIIDAMVDMPVSRAMAPDAPDSAFANPDDIAESVFFLARQPRSAWTFELDLRPFREPW
jgi:NADP-dependent 3-hydroxy acid dehydrogenase YdfG